MKVSLALLTFVTAVLAVPSKPCDECENNGGGKKIETGNVCDSHQTVVCQGQGKGGLITLGNVLPGALGENCAGGDVYCCSQDDVQQLGLVNLDVNAQCSLNHVL
ncbi:hypothetical protein N7448_002481 [Penicillium atrosanguineum]|uniref:Hydrophobin n=1 Tax=Penicillium atrosanguineum TaxID=1132637 RepID=A0A9W9L957_9EURO|nr:uncharacterized protein N7443_005882 [Penicillium atrosanguineum]KAJ5128765.1 hypothetical protein N7526_006931 [Penicillium atrosanguineum]KAJ5145089.1 hypothetical protein N7448_002481 [Penicillium atrosanguineum]KAJ5300880.1 hypothetical protein N7443_005882 [Penicillium atrosanguineum]KAJ5311524.1 hypothetical protein N7476_007384 [Penicillium atrosanguineum]